MGSSQYSHFVMFPFMSQGHVIPLLHLSRLLSHRSVTVTIFTTTGNYPAIHDYIKDINSTAVSIVELPFPQNIEGVPPGVENTHKLPSMSCLLPFLKATKLMQKSFEQSLETLHPPVSCIISDVFLGWTLETATKFGVPRLACSGMGSFSSTMCDIMGREKPHTGTKSLDEPFSVPGFPNLKLTRNDFEPPWNEIEPSGLYVEFMLEQFKAATMSHGVVVNSFYELEASYVDFLNKQIGPKAYCVGPLCMAVQPPSEEKKKPCFIQFLDEKLAKEAPVLYVSFGTQAEVTKEQIQEISKGLERSGASFLWVLKPKLRLKFQEKFEERVKGRGMIVEDWVDQQRILQHEGVKGFLSHCGWNSVLESMSAGVPILALPLMAEQHLNARFVAEEIGVGLRIMTRGGSVRGFVEAEEVDRAVMELMGNERGAEVRRKMADYAKAACDAMKEGGSSWRTLDLLIDDVRGKKTVMSWF